MSENNTPQSYAGFTIGPIYDVLSYARKTRELWFGSYFFSWFMEKIIEELAKNSVIEFLVPYVETPFQLNNTITGKYHDRFIMRSSLDKDTLYNEIQKASDNALEYFVDLIDNLVKSPSKYLPGVNKDRVRDELKGYIQRNFVVLEPSAIDKGNVVKSISSYLDSMEENRFFNTGILDKTCSICKTLPAVVENEIWIRTWTGEVYDEKKQKEKLCPLCFVKYSCYKSGDIEKKIDQRDFRYPPVLDISARELLTPEVKKTNTIFKDPEKDYDFEDIEKAVKSVYDKEKAKEIIKPYHKYLAIVQADGDNLGEVLKQYPKPDGIAIKFSKPLLDFAKEAEIIINSYKGYPIYIGGDDILAFMSVAIKGDDDTTKTVFDLAMELSDKYRDIVDKKNGKTTLSIGINIAYYKYPLSRAMHNTREQLFNKAKAGSKNALAMLLTKHSGHQIGFKFRFNTRDIKIFSKLLSETLAGQIDLPHSLHHNLSRFKTVIAHTPDEDRLNAFFENNFNEPIHSKYYQGIAVVADYFKKVILCEPEGKRLNCVEEILSKLAFIKFLRGEK
ncbi:MAG TPA: type III-B CRISPR-associated protein Cas10/Cmr2 [Proteobacteria bacterium]|nr:type III-B CRISPR-associated protein Cas10/Cmr2 [Pseudomonadota bacterium]